MNEWSIEVNVDSMQASNPIVCKALRPALQLASRMIDNAQFPWYVPSLADHLAAEMTHYEV